jgi:hypothetical protein
MFGGNYRPTSNWFDCSMKFGCPRPVLFKTTEISVERNGNIEKMVIKQPTVPYWQYRSQTIKNSTYYTAGQQFVYSNNTLDPFGYWAGAPMGSGTPPRNTF